jgi:hypothetical protein
MGIFNRNNADNKRALVASYGGVIKGGSPANPEFIARRAEEWQKRVLHYHQCVPEVHAAASFVSGTSSRLTFESPKIPDNTQSVIDRSLRTFDNGRAAQLLFLVGEYYAMWRYDAARNMVLWDILSPLEVEFKDKKPFKVRDFKTGDMRPLDSDERIFRVWYPDARDRSRADSAHRSLLDVLEAMYLHQLADTTVATSRLAGAGILYIPDDELPSVPVADGGTAEPGTREYVEQLIGGSMVSSLKNRDVHDALVPVMMFGSSDHASGLKHTLLERPDDADAFASRMKAYTERYSIGIDLPPEIVTGMGSVTRWTAAKVDQNFWAYYLAPMNQITADALNANFVEQLAGELNQNLNDVDLIVQGTNVIQKPDLTEAAIRLKDLNVISDAAAARAAGFNPDEDLSPEGSMITRNRTTENRPDRQPASEAGDNTPR